ncbi:MAG: hypothetical protein V4596_07695 [Bdellovibrionota bacterium]
MKIKKLSICALVLILASASVSYSGESEIKPVYKGQSGNGSSNSGDPYDVHAVTFPDKDKLNKAMELAEKKLLSSNLSNSLITSTIAEMKKLAADDKYLYLESLVLLKEKMSSADSEAAKIFTGFGALTEPFEGTIIYFSKRALEYDLEAFTKHLIHELLHHSLDYNLSTDEELVELIAQQVMLGKVEPEILLAISKGIYIREGVVRASQILEYWNRIPVVNSKLETRAFKVCLQNLNKKKKTKEMEEFVVRVCLEAARYGINGVNMITKLKSENVWNLPVDFVSEVVSEEIERVEGYQGITITHVRGYKAIRKMVMDLGYQDPLNRWSDIFCKKKRTLFTGRCNGTDRVLMKDLFQ